MFQYPLVGRGGSNYQRLTIPTSGKWVSVPSGGSWWEQLAIQEMKVKQIYLFQYPLVGRGGSNQYNEPVTRPSA